MWCMSRDLWNTSAAVLNLTVLKTNKEYNIYCTNNSKLALCCVCWLNQYLLLGYTTYTHIHAEPTVEVITTVCSDSLNVQVPMYFGYLCIILLSHISHRYSCLCLSVYLSVHMCVHPCVFVSVCTCSNALLLGRLACWHFGVRAMQGEWCWLTAWNLFIIQP